MQQDVQSSNDCSRFPDDRSDSGVSSLRSGSSGDERSGSRSSALSSIDEPSSSQLQLLFANNNSSNTTSTSSSARSPFNRSPLFVAGGLVAASHHHPDHPARQSSYRAFAGDPNVAALRVWRDQQPQHQHHQQQQHNSSIEVEPQIRHVHSVQHRSLLMSHQPTQSPAVSGPPPATSAGVPTASLYAPVAQPPSLINPHGARPLPSHLAPSIYSHHLPEMLWKSPYNLPTSPAGIPSAAHLMAASQTGHHPEELIERERAMMHNERIASSIRERQNMEAREMKEREKERAEKEKHEKMEREREEKERQEQALQNHFEKSLRQAAQQKREQWNPITGRPTQQRNNSADEEKKRVEQEIREQRHLASRLDAKDNRFYGNMQQQRVPNIPNKSDYPPPAHSRVSASKQTEKMATLHPANPKGELNMFGYPAYHPQNAFAFTHDAKSKDMHKSSAANVGLVSKSASPIERDNLPNPPPLISEMKNSVIVKHDAKNSHHQMEARVPMAHSPSPKMRTEMMNHHYMPMVQTSKGNMYEYRSPTQSPHHLQHSSPHHMEVQNVVGKSQQQQHHRSAQLSNSPHHQRQQQQSSHGQQHPSPEMRYRAGGAESQAVIYPTSSKANYQFLQATTAGYGHHTTNVASNSKPKVSSPAPHHIYGKPGILTGVPPVSRGEHNAAVQIQLSAKPLPLPSSISPSPYQQVSQYHPPPQVSTQLNCPPPAHSRTNSNMERSYERLYPGASIPGVIPSKQSSFHGTSPPTATAAPPLVIARNHPQYVPSVTIPSGMPNSPSVQTQPLDLGISSSNKQQQQQQQHENNNCGSPKRKGTPVHMERSTTPVDAKKRRMDASSLPPASGSPQLAYATIGQQQQQQQHHQQQHQLQLLSSRVSEPMPLIASAATAVTTSNAYVPMVTPAAAQATTVGAQTNSAVALTENLPDLSVTPVGVVNVEWNLSRPGSAEQIINNRTTTPQPVQQTVGGNNSSCGSSGGNNTSNNGGDSPISNNNGAATVTLAAPVSGKESPNTLKSTIPPSSIDSEKSNSPGPNKSSGSYPVRHLKKAWLQRHTGEDLEDTTGVVGSGSCVTLPININNSNSSNNNKEHPVNSLHSIGSMAVNSISKPKHLANKSTNRKIKETPVNGHPNESTNKGDDSSSSDPERGRKSPPKRKPPKVKRKKGGGVHKKTSEEKKRKTNTPTVASESGSDSDKDTGSEKDSDSGASTTVSLKKGTAGKEPRKRGRRPKISKNDKGEEPRPKKSKEDVLPQRDPFRKPPVGQLKKTGESFLQDGPCFEVAPKLAKCRECRWTPNQRSKNMPNIFCRFYAFRRLRYTKNGQLAIAGFSDPHKNSLEDDIKLWLPNPENPPGDLDLETSRFLLKQVGDHFCDLLVQEKNALEEHLSDDKTVAWKRVVQGVREMCDVCETTLFNFHWACGKCGFVVCLDCYKGRKSGTLKVWGDVGKDRDELSWLLCTNRSAHEQEKLMLTQIIADNCLVKLGKMVHEIRELWNIEQFCDCPLSNDVKSNNVKCKEMIKNMINDKMNGNISIKKEIGDEDDDDGDNDASAKPSANGVAQTTAGANSKNNNEKSSPLSWLADVALSNEDKKPDETSSEDDDNNFSTLRELLIRPSHKQNGSRASSPTTNNQQQQQQQQQQQIKSTTKKTNNNSSKQLDNLEEVLTSVIEENSPKATSVEVVEETNSKCELKHFVRRYNWQAKGRISLPIRIMTLTESKMLYPNVPHSWLCDGKLLRLSDPTHKDNYKIFQDQWKRGQPVIVSDVSRLLNKDLWHPDAFARDFGEDKNDLINCMTGNLVPNQPMKRFWEGFEHFQKRLKDDRGNPMLLKLKDWPPGEDFAEMLPSRFQDLMDVLPLAEYTHRNGRLNLASRLPDCFVRPDLGPKMYNAYGSALHPSKGTTNLHLDISDAVNVMVYVGIPKDSDSDEHVKEAFRAIDEAGCDILTRRRVRDKGELPGALWHIYNAKDADKIRDLLNKVVVEKSGRLEPHHDPIHDQSCYLDGPLRERLYKEYGVEGYAIVQCLGDAVFIPAGAPHQVRNLHNCIKVAEDFVSPENVSHCFHLTQEFRDLSDTHSNHEDKLQIKNIIYHAVKDSLSSLTSIFDKNMAKYESRTDGGGEDDEEGGGGGGLGAGAETEAGNEANDGATTDVQKKETGGAADSVADDA